MELDEQPHFERRYPMTKAIHKKVQGKSADVLDRLGHKGIYCISNKWVAWAKRYVNRSQRRKAKQLKEETR